MAKERQKAKSTTIVEGDLETPYRACNFQKWPQISTSTLLPLGQIITKLRYIMSNYVEHVV